MANFKDTTGASWNKIGEILNDIYEGKGNYALAKKMELELDKALTEGYKNAYGKNIMPNEEYLKKKGSIEGKDYLSIDESNDYIPDDDDARIFGMKQSKKTYSNATELIKSETKKAEQNFHTDINIKQIDKLSEINFDKISENEYIKLSKEVFKEHISKRTFHNDNTNIDIKVILSDIKESAYKAYNSKLQRKYLREHIETLSQINKVIQEGIEVSKNNELKNRKQYKSWRYFSSQAIIENKPFLIQFDVTKKDDGYHFRLQRLAELNIKNKRSSTLALTNTSRC